MKNDNINAFWRLYDKMVCDHKIIIDRPKGSIHPQYPDWLYPLDYGYLQGTLSMDNGGIDIWIGTSLENKIVGCIITVDSIKNDSEVKLLYSCTDDEIAKVLEVHNRSPYMKGLLIRR